MSQTPLNMPTKYNTLLLIHVFKANLSKIKKLIRAHKIKFFFWVEKDKVSII